MYRFASDLRLDELVGSEIQQICVGPSDVQFRFDSGTCIAVQSRATLLQAGEMICAWAVAGGWSTSEFQRLFNCTIDGYAVLNDRLLEIRFISGLALQFHDDSDQFESLQIYLGGSAIDSIVI